MARSGRRLVYTEEKVRALFAKMRGDFHRQHFATLCELADLKRQLDEMRAELHHTARTQSSRA